jgi:hypothetical protein
VRGSERVVVVAEVDVDLVVVAGIEVEVDMVVAGKAGLRVRRIHGLVFVAAVGVVWYSTALVRMSTRGRGGRRRARRLASSGPASVKGSRRCFG